jgi:hypothetical protein
METIIKEQKETTVTEEKETKRTGLSRFLKFLMYGGWLLIVVFIYGIILLYYLTK